MKHKSFSNLLALVGGVFVGSFLLTAAPSIAALPKTDTPCNDNDPNCGGAGGGTTKKKCAFDNKSCVKGTKKCEIDGDTCKDTDF